MIRCRCCLSPIPPDTFVQVCQECYLAYRRRECICDAVRCEGRSGLICCPKHGRVEIKSRSVGVLERGRA